MNRRAFLREAGATAMLAHWARGQTPELEEATTKARKAPRMLPTVEFG